MNNTYKSGQWNAVCNHCEQSKPVDEFYIHSNGKPRKQCKTCHYKRGKNWLEENREIVNRQAVQRRQKDPTNFRKAVTKWRKANLSYDAYRVKVYTARKTQRLVPWADLEKIKSIYKNCPAGWHVDHIIPLNGQLVSGLHVETNLQYLPAAENCKKGNRYVCL